MGKNIEKSIENFIDEMGIFGMLLEKLLIATIVIFLGCIAMKIVLTAVRKIMDRSKLDEVLHIFVENTVKISFWILIIITTLSLMGVPTTTFITVIGACGAAVALALKDSLANFAGGILIIFNKPFSTDDLIELVEVGSIKGKVKQIDLLYSTLITPDNQIITVPNGLLANHVVVNHSRADRRRVDCQFSIGYSSDIERAKNIIRRIVVESDLFIHDIETTIGVSEHGESAIVIDALAWCSTEDYFNAKYYLMESVKLAFDKEGIEIPYPHMVVQCEKTNVKL